MIPLREAGGGGSGEGGLSGTDGEGRERGARRRKLAGYLKAANELRQSYAQSYTQRGSRPDGMGDGDLEDTPGAWPDMAMVRSGQEEMVLFPGYAKRHIRGSSSSTSANRTTSAQGTEGGSEAEYWRREWESHEDENAVVDVDVRGWIYSPHRGPLNRKNRLLIGLARQLSGIPAPPTDQTQSRGRDEEVVSREASTIARRGEGEADVAGRGGYSETPNDADTASVRSFGSGGTGSGRVTPEPVPGQIAHPVTNSSLDQGQSGGQNRAGWSMSASELAEANAHLMRRLKPFMTTPLPNVPVTLFFFNDTASQSRTTMTNEAGHFSDRFALDFVPTQVRVLASEGLSATEDVRVTDPSGVSLISDIDDTIKHSAIGSGAREIFRNTFVRELADLTVEGVTDWYKRLADLGVKLHYVSNSPWQLYPLLTSFFALAGLPPGSFHLKQYSGMLQGIFEPVAERKKGTLERIMQDFPDRKFILVGDSGEADLEVYTELVMANPGRIIGVYIRDVTTPKTQGFFDSTGPTARGSTSTGPSATGSTATGVDESDTRESRPPVPPRRPAEPQMGQLVDISDDTPPLSGDTPPLASSRPPPPTKPPSLRSGSATRKPPVPPQPRRPSTLRNESSPASSNTSASPSTASSPGPIENKPPPPPPRRSQTSTESPPAFEAPTLPSRKPSEAPEPPPRKPSAAPPPPRRNLTSYPAAAAQYAGNRLGFSQAANSSSTSLNATNGGANGAAPVVNKKEELWKRRWERAREVLVSRGVELRSWRVGNDVLEQCVVLVQRAQKDMNEK